MSLSRPQPIHDESGTTLVELMVGMMTAMFILSALTMAIVSTMHGAGRVTSRVEATQRARLAVNRLMQDLHSACVAPEIAPVKEESSGNTLRFVHQTGSAVQPTPIYSVVSFAGGSLTQQDYEVEGVSPNWAPSNPIGSPRTLLTDVSPTPPSESIFSYYRYSAGTISETPQATPLSASEAALTVEVRASFTAAPERTPVEDAGAAASIQDSATLRLTPPSFNEGSPSRPCQ